MKSFLTFDYELFFGRNSGSLEKCIIEPTNALLKIANEHNGKLIFFVDAGYILALKNNRSKHKKLASDYNAISRQIDKIVKDRHDIQLHIHPHWNDSHFTDESWNFNTDRYKLSDFPEKDIIEICQTYKQALTEYTQPEKIFAYRAGGWCIQPFEKLKEGLSKANIWLDSSVYSDGVNVSLEKGFDFRGAPKKDIWKFEIDPLKEEPNGSFIELPISSTQVNPGFYWQVMINRFLAKNNHEIFGDGTSISSGNHQYIKLLTAKSEQPVFLDGIKSQLLMKAYNNHITKKSEFFVAIGHPKCMSKYSLLNMENLMKKNKANLFLTFNDCVSDFKKL